VRPGRASRIQYVADSREDRGGRVGGEEERAKDVGSVCIYNCVCACINAYIINATVLIKVHG
jgi:23S rRNA A1618 N6-methylase RlmF